MDLALAGGGIAWASFWLRAQAAESEEFQSVGPAPGEVR